MRHPASALRRRCLGALAALAAVGARATPAADAGFPQPVRLVVPMRWASARTWWRAAWATSSRQWGNRCGWTTGRARRASSPSTRCGARRRPTLFVADTATLVVNRCCTSLPYDPQRDLQPLSLLFRATFLVWVGGGSRFATLAGLMAAARREPGRVSYGSLGNGHASQVAIETFASAADIRLLHVPFKDAGALFAAVAAGEVDFTAFSMNTLAGLMAAGRMRPLAVAAPHRLPSHPSIPTLAEAGGPAIAMQPWAALVTVAGVPPGTLEPLQRGIAAALASSEVLARAAQAGFEITPSTPQALRERMAADRAQTEPLLREGRISAV